MGRKAVFFDCDGTLLSHHTNTVPASAKLALKALQENGILTVLSTGRHLCELKKLSALNGLHFDAYITLNGAYSFDEKGIIEEWPIEAEDIQTVYEFLKKHIVPVQFFEAEHTFISSVNDTVIRSQQMIHTPVPETGRTERILEEPVYMMVPFGIQESEPLIRSLNHVAVTRWSEHDACDLIHESAGKERGMRAVMKRYGIERGDAAAFGDAMNDHSMLEEAGIGVCMGNGDPSLKETADYVTDDIDENGILHGLIEIGFLKESLIGGK